MPSDSLLTNIYTDLAQKSEYRITSDIQQDFDLEPNCVVAEWQSICIPL